MLDCINSYSTFMESKINGDETWVYEFELEDKKPAEIKKNIH